MKLLEPLHPFFDPPLARWLTVVLPILWAMVEFWMASPIWGAAFLAVGLYAGWMLFIQRPRELSRRDGQDN